MCRNSNRNVNCGRSVYNNRIDAGTLRVLVVIVVARVVPRFTAQVVGVLVVVVVATVGGGRTRRALFENGVVYECGSLR